MSEQIRLGVDTSGMSEGFQRLQSEASSALGEMIRKSRAYSSSSKEVLKDIEDQVKALERRNKLESDLAKQDLSIRRSSGELNEKQYKSRMTEVSLDDKDKKEQTKILRELLNETISKANEQIRENRQGVERTIAATNMSELNDAAFIAVAAQQAQLQDRKSGGDSESSKSEMGSYIRTSIESLGQVLTSRNSEMTAAKLLGQSGGMVANIGGQIPGIAGAAISMIAGKVEQIIETHQQYEDAVMRSTGVTGRQASLSTAKSLEHLGYSAIDYQNSVAEISRARGSYADPGAYLRMQRGMGLDGGTIGQFETMLRNNRGYSGWSGTNIPAAADSMFQAGIANKGDYSMMPEYLQTLVSLGQQQLSELGHLDMTMNMRVASGLAKLSDDFRNPQVAGNVINKLHQGLSGSGTPQQQALQYSVLSRMRNDKGDPLSMFEMEEFRADPFSEQSKQYLPKYLEQLKAMSQGNDEQFFFNIMSNFGMSAPMARKLGTGFIDKGGEYSDWMDKDFKGGTGYADIPGHARERAESINKDIESYETAVETLKALKEFSKELIKGVQDANAQRQAIGDEMMRSNNSIANSVGAIVASPQLNMFK